MARRERGGCACPRGCGVGVIGPGEYPIGPFGVPHPVIPIVWMRWRDQSGSVRLRRGETDEVTVEAERPTRATVGVMIDSLRNSYQTTVLAGLAAAAYRRDVDIVVLAGGVLGIEGSEGEGRNFLFDLCGPHSVDGVVVLGGALGNQRGPAAVAEICARLAPLPLACLAMSPPN